MIELDKHLGHRIAFLLSVARSFFRATLDFVYPPFCLLCGTYLDIKEELVCRSCWQSLPLLKKPCMPVVNLHILSGGTAWFDRSIAVYEYSPSVQELIHHFKYFGMQHLAKDLGQNVAEGIIQQNLIGEIDAFIPVPLHSQRIRERGYNQAELLAKEMAKLCGVPCWKSILLRTRYTQPQAAMNREERRSNIQGAFSIKDGSKIDKARIALVDDVLTTGSTMNECAHVLRQAGASSVISVTVVRI